MKRYLTDVSNYNEKFVRIGYNFLKKYKGHNVISMGHSPYYIIKSAEMLSKELDKHIDITYLPFSGSYGSICYDHTLNGITMQSMGLSKDKMVIENGNVKYIDIDYTSYQEYLKKVNITPQVIMDNFNKTGKPFILADLIGGGNSMASFLDIMEDLAKKQNVNWDAKALKIVSFTLEDREDITLQSKNNHQYKVDNFDISEEKFDFQDFDTQERAIPSFYNHHWGNTNYLPNWNITQENHKYPERPVSPETCERASKIMPALEKQTKLVADVHNALEEIVLYAERESQHRNEQNNITKL